MVAIGHGQSPGGSHGDSKGLRLSPTGRREIPDKFARVDAKCIGEPKEAVEADVPEAPLDRRYVREVEARAFSELDLAQPGLGPVLPDPESEEVDGVGVSRAGHRVDRT